MESIETLIAQSGVQSFLLSPEMMMGVQYFIGSIDFDNGIRLPIKALLLSSYYVIPIADDDFQRDYLSSFNKPFIDRGQQFAAFSCIRKNENYGWSLVYSESATARNCEPSRRPNMVFTSSYQQYQSFMQAVSQGPSQQILTLPAAGTPLTTKKVTTADEGFLRFTFSIPDRRVDTINGIVAPGTYCSPYRDGQKISSGYEAVGRFALPVPLPYKHVILLVSPTGTNVEIGTAIPNFGQAGGGVEAFFPSGFINPNLHYHSLPEY